MDKEGTKRAVSSLVETFKRYESEGRLSGLNESNTRNAFIDPLFEALGWNMRDLEEVSLEESVSSKRVDYAFRVSGVIRFFVEAKAAGVPLEEKEARQAIDYAYYKAVPWVILTNFRQLIIYNSELEEGSQRFLLFEFSEYVERLDELLKLSKEGFASGELDNYAEKVGKGKKREPITKKLFSDLRQWRKELSSNIAGHSRMNKLDSEQIEEGVQKLLNRFVFIRTCEDRGLENQKLREAVRICREENKKRLMRYLGDVFDEFNEVYDSDLFAPHLAGELYIDNAVLERIIEGMYSYRFNDIDADVLGNVYEQYLAAGIGEKGQLRDKKMIRKEMGIYYTPTYIVDYIVKNTLGELIGKAKNASELSKIRVLDPACGSGSFLIRAFETLGKAYAKTNGGDNEMLTENVSRNAYDILTKNLHGVDLDAKAVEIAELNLLLRAARRRGRLPLLSENIKRGNSLISGTPEEMEKYFGKHWEQKHPFNWEEKFAEVMKEGGFDVVVGNPPYGADVTEEEKIYYVNKYKTTLGKINSYRLFIERTLQLLKDGGLLGLIVPNTWLSDNDSERLRKLILENYKVLKILVLPESLNVFEGVTQATTVIIIQKQKNSELVNNNEIIFMDDVTSKQNFDAFITGRIKQGLFCDFDGYKLITREPVLKIIRKVLSKGKDRIPSLFEVRQGEVNLTNYKEHLRAKRETGTRNLIRGDNIVRYCLVEGSGKEGYVVFRHIERDDSDKKRIILQEVSNMTQIRRLKATLLDHQANLGHTCNYLYLKDKKAPIGAN
jgi:type I restriction-modification system DNA methylase subunit